MLWQVQKRLIMQKNPFILYLIRQPWKGQGGGWSVASPQKHWCCVWGRSSPVQATKLGLHQKWCPAGLQRAGELPKPWPKGSPRVSGG